ncbi:hypothetical protein ABAC460_20220 [Asticcacaulis sp. AC460]|uniref:hypothetical protein n=1 Tax=Asticcacaulis sp. AC460 TaxID=1282360 RepID=UPI0003C3F099|nr:hypothetical protein [Asticcacaulis sp. AC460]ESQ87352.1 hypothetical protein ABAC460_20220 [Asticcacaulis sp. AC460]
MTSEVLLMNLEAVAMGADSAVTILDTGNGSSVSQGGIEKIHILNEAGPVAVMVYGGGDFAGLPWSAVIGQFREAHPGRRGPVRDQAQNLIRFLSGDQLKGDDKAEQISFGRYMISFLLDFGDCLKTFGWEEGKPVSPETAAQALARLTQEVMFAGHDAKGQPVARTLLPESPRLAPFLQAHLGQYLEHFLGQMLDGAAFPEKSVAPLRDLAAASVLVEWLPARSLMFLTGLAIAGFDGAGSAPSMVHLEFLGSFGGILKAGPVGAIAPKPRTNPIIAATFAQDAMTRAFMYGATPAYEHITHMVSASYIYRELTAALGETARSQPALAKALASRLDNLALVAPLIGASVARQARHDQATRKLWPLLETANAGILANYAGKFMELPVVEHELMRDDGVSRPIRILAMEPGRYFWKD